MSSEIKIEREVIEDYFDLYKNSRHGLDIYGFKAAVEDILSKTVISEKNKSNAPMSSEKLSTHLDAAGFGRSESSFSRSIRPEIKAFVQSYPLSPENNIEYVVRVEYEGIAGSMLDRVDKVILSNGEKEKVFLKQK